MPKTDIFKHSADNETRRTLILNITNACNLKCKYCYEKKPERTDIIMDFNIAKDAISKYMKENDNFDSVEIQFFGGEPLLAFPLIKKIVEWFHQKKWKKKHIFFIPTNGTILTNEMKEWLSVNRNDVIVGFSLDGNKTAHNLGRDNSYDMVMKNLPFFLENWPGQTAKMTIYKETIPFIAESIIELEEKDINFAANVVFENIWGTPREKENLLNLYNDQLSLLVDYYNDHPDLIPVSLVNRKIEYIITPEEVNQPNKNRLKFCGAGDQSVAVDVDGTIYPCHRFISSYNNQCAVPKEPVNQRDKWEPESCQNCKLVVICPICIGYNLQVHGDPSIRTTYHCEAFKYEILASAKLQALRITKQIASSNSEEDKIILKRKVNAILKLMDEGI